MINFRNYKENNSYFILSQNLDPELFPIDLFGPVKCGILDPPGELIRIRQEFNQKRRFFESQEEFADEGGICNGVWVYFRSKKKMEDFLAKKTPLFIKDYEQLDKAIPFKLLRKRVFIP
jgi:hypothetical protein